MKLSFEELYNQMKKNLEGNFQDLIENAKKESKRNTKISLIICIIIDIIIVLLFIVKGIGNDVALLIRHQWFLPILVSTQNFLILEKTYSPFLPLQITSY